MDCSMSGFPVHHHLPELSINKVSLPLLWIDLYTFCFLYMFWRKIIALLLSVGYFNLSFSFLNIYLLIWPCRSQLYHESHGSFVASPGLSSCGTQASGVAMSGLCPQARGILVLRPGTEPASHTSQGVFLTTGSPGKSCFSLFWWRSNS